MSGELADDIRSAMEEASSAAPPADNTPEPAAAPEPAASEPAAESTPAPTGRDTSGRFAPRTPANDGKPLPEDGQPPAQAAPVDQQAAPAAPAYKAPASWKPEAREEWAKAPPAIQAEVQRREREITETLRTTAEARHFHQQFNQVAQPYLGMMQAENATPIQAFQNLMQTAATLRTGSAMQKAELAAAIITQHGIDIQQLDNLLSARMNGTAAPQQAPQQYRDPRLDEVLGYVSTLRQREQQQEQQVMQTLQQETEEFMNNPEMEFAWDVKDDMADILDLAAKRGQKISLQDAYNRATMLHPTISEIVQRRRLEQGAASGSEAALRAKRAAVSIPNNGAPGRASEDNESDDLRSAIAASMRVASRR